MHYTSSYSLSSNVNTTLSKENIIHYSFKSKGSSYNGLKNKVIISYKSGSTFIPFASNSFSISDTVNLYSYTASLNKSTDRLKIEFSGSTYLIGTGSFSSVYVLYDSITLSEKSSSYSGSNLLVNPGFENTSSAFYSWEITSSGYAWTPNGMFNSLAYTGVQKIDDSTSAMFVVSNEK